MSAHSKFLTACSNYWQLAKFLLLHKLKSRRMGSFSSLFGIGVTLLVGILTLWLLLLWLYPWLRRDLRFLSRFVRSFLKYRSSLKQRRFLVDELEEKVKRHPKKVFTIFEDKEYTYEEMNTQIDKLANTALSIGLKKGDIVAIFLYNEPAFIWTYLGLAKIGVQIAFLNFNLRSKSLLHCLDVSGAKVLMVSQRKEMLSAVEEIYADLQGHMSVYVWGEHTALPSGFKSLQSEFQQASANPIPRSVRSGIRFHDPMCYIFTSGTTGLPKAAIITHSRACKGALLMTVKDVGSKDIIYTPLPLYHSAAGLIALGTTMLTGATMVIRGKFSATHFFEDCARHNVTVVQYIGELCRYLLAKPPSPSDKAHKVQLAFGNGLRMDIWQEFVTRFNIPEVCEFYAATEGNNGFINLSNKTGSVGACTPFTRLLMPAFFVKYNYETEEPVRNEDGFCILSGADEVGLMITPIRRDLEYDGYKGQKDLSEKKVLRDVFIKGDIYYNSGDLFTLDKDYYVYFADRIGDTFRWKGENVSTIEVSNMMCDLGWIEDANVYGVEIPGNDGRAGMAAITVLREQKVTRDKLAELFLHCSKTLPSYALPRFLRFQAEMEVTSTFKQRKVELVKEGFDPTKTKDSLVYCIDFPNKTYTLLTDGLYKDILAGKKRL